MSKRILLLGLNFAPELVGIGKYTGDLADYLVQAGFDLRVVTAPPYYPEWKIDGGYHWWAYYKESTRKMTLYRCPLWVPRRPTHLNRVPHLISFALSSLPVMLAQILWKPDLVICVIPTLFSAPIAWLTARLCGSKCWLHIQDFELDAANNLGMLSFFRFFIKLASQWEKWIYFRFDRISTISIGMVKSLEKKSIFSERIILFPNWVDTRRIFPISNPQDTLRNALNISSDKIVVLYSGAMGAKQGLEDLVYAAHKLKGNPDIIFIFCGNGPFREELIHSTQHLPNVKCLPIQPLENLNSLLNTADIHIMPQKANVADLVMPSKLLGMLASGKVIISNAAENTELGRIIGQVGYLVHPQDASGFMDAILNLAASPALRSRLGAQGRKYVCDNWSADLVLSRFLAHLNKLLNEKK